ncbi:class C beta-lactamase [Aureimonas mangrovi]|uniref:class C beta-lactamase n=1 Tax=Aureimonas mangrovi TaxID=2758041 RepID=UPI00163DC87C|nr:class C beta-lactamase [Aureimonas mangrovi]
MSPAIKFAASSLALAMTLASAPAWAQGGPHLEAVVDAAIEPVMTEHDVPGMAVAVLSGGEVRFFNYGVTAPEGEEPVSQNTIFEVGSVSKLFTATLAAYAEERGRLALADSAAQHMPQIEGSAIGTASLDQLGTYAAGGLPLQFPDEVTGEDGLVAFYRNFDPPFEAGSHRLYSNPSIGLLGYLTARALGERFDMAMERTLMPAFGLADTFVRVPQARMGEYAWGTSRDGQAIRVTPGALDSEAYGIKTTAADLARFVAAQMEGTGLDTDWQAAVRETRRGRYTVGPMTQALGWERYDDAEDLDALLEGNSTEMALEPQEIAAPAEAPAEAFFNKTGSTGGFGAYVAMVPARGVAVVMLANRNYPNASRVEAAHAILGHLD